MCNALGDLKDTLVNRPSGVFDLANCAESNGRAAEAVRLLEKYLEMSPSALDGDEVRARIADLKAQLTLPGASGIEIRRLYASIYDSLAESKYDRALADLQKASALAPEFALTQWKLGLLYEAMGNVEKARTEFHDATSSWLPSKKRKTKRRCISARWMRRKRSTTKRSMKRRTSSPICSRAR